MNINEFEESFNTSVKNSGNTANTANTTNLGVDLDNVMNTDNSWNDSGNVAVGIQDSGNTDSHNVELESRLSVEDSYNDNSDHSTENTVEDSYNDESDHSVNDSYNTLTDNSVVDASINAGVRSYNTGFGDFTLHGGGGGGGAGGDIWIDSSATVVDQSFNGNVAAFGAGFESDNEAVVASGANSMAAGGDIDVEQNLDRSMNVFAGGDVNMGNDTKITTVSDSYNTSTENSVEDDHSINTDIHDSYNDNSQSYTATNSFNEELNSASVSDWDVDTNVIWDSEDAIIADHVDLDVEL